MSCPGIIQKTKKVCGAKVKENGFCGRHKSLAVVPKNIEDPGNYIPSKSQKDYITDAANLKRTLKRYGVAIIKKVIHEEILNMRSGFWDYFEHITSQWEIPIQREDGKTWNQFYKLLPLHGMLMQHWGVGHSQHLWDLRQNEKIVQIFEVLWETKDLLVSFDGMSFAPPHEVTKRGYYRENKWFHFDQAYNNTDFDSVQSWVTAYDVKPGDATLTFIEGSNSQRPYFVQHHDLSGKENWEKIKDEHIDWFVSRGCRVQDIVCEAGDMVFWDSRTAHAGKEAIKQRDESNFRMVAYLCYTPRSLASDAALKKKEKALKELRTTTHTPHKVKLFAQNPRSYGNELPQITPIEAPKLTKLGLRLAGSI